MGSPSGNTVEREEISQLNRILDSHLLRGADSLSRLLRFLTEHALKCPGETLKEHQIATMVLGRRPDFDPNSDSTLRVQIGRLRSRLERYYNEVGPRDQVIIEIPRGSYSVAFHLSGSRTASSGSHNGRNPGDCRHHSTKEGLTNSSHVALGGRSGSDLYPGSCYRLAPAN